MEENQSFYVVADSNSNLLAYLPTTGTPCSLELGYPADCALITESESPTFDEAGSPELSYVPHATRPQSLSSFVAISSASLQNHLQATADISEYNKLVIKAEPAVAASNAVDLTSPQANSPDSTRMLRRRAQNRTAQRAFRERKDQYLKNLQSKVAKLEIAHQKLTAENELLAKEIKNISALIPAGSLTFTCCDTNGRRISTSVSRGCQTEPTGDDGDCFYSTGAAWDFIINHRLYDESHVDVDALIEKLKYRAHSYVCGPLFTKSAIMETLRQSVKQKAGRPCSNLITEAHS